MAKVKPPLGIDVEYFEVTLYGGTRAGFMEIYCNECRSTTVLPIGPGLSITVGRHEKSCRFYEHAASWQNLKRELGVAPEDRIQS